MTRLLAGSPSSGEPSSDGRRLREVIQKYGSLDRFYLETDFSKGTFRRFCGIEPPRLPHRACSKRRPAQRSPLQTLRDGRLVAPRREANRLNENRRWRASAFPPRSLIYLCFSHRSDGSATDPAGVMSDFSNSRNRPFRLTSAGVRPCDSSQRSNSRNCHFVFNLGLPDTNTEIV